MRLLWVGRFHAKKRPSWILDLAEACPQTRIDVVGDGRQGDSTVEEFLRRASRIAHVTLHGRLAPGTLGPFYDQADLLICTSLNEGFPNTFLEAWARGTPTVSTFDPDGIISRHRMGAAGHTIAELRDAVERFHASPDRWADSSRQARAFFLKNHTVSAAADAYENVLREISNEQVEAVFPSATF
jgi:glycosyltransferase involved in cell wall biosynthesis